MTENDVLQRLVREGALIYDQQADILTMPIHAELLGQAPYQRLFWVQAGAEDQHHTHARAFDAAQVFHDRDLALTAQGEPVAYVAPFAEWPQYDPRDLREEFVRAHVALNDLPAQARCADFVAATRRDAIR